MEAIDVIMTALTAGAASGMKDIAASTVKGTHARVVELIRARFAQHSDPETANLTLAKYEEKPEVWREPLRDVLLASGADQDAEIVAEARLLLTHVNPQQIGMGKYNTQIAGPVQGFVQGDHADVKMSFGKPTPSDEETGAK